MFRTEGRTWAYLFGVIIMFVILVFLTIQVVIPLLRGERSIGELDIFAEKPDFTIDTDLDYIATMETSEGALTIDLFEKSTPVNVNNFVYLSNQDYYDRTESHRLIPGFLIQGGDRNTLDDNPENDGKGNPGYILDDEINLESLGLSSEEIAARQEEGYQSNGDLISNPLTKNMIAMANDGPNTNGSQFFIILADETDSRLTEMNGRFTVIGEVISGFDVLDIFRNTPVDNPNLNSPRPLEPITITDVEVLTR